MAIFQFQKRKKNSHFLFDLISKLKRTFCYFFRFGFFSFFLTSGSREAAYLYAVWSSGLTYAIAQACSQGAISSCGCDPTKRGGKELIRSMHRSHRAHNAATANNGGNNNGGGGGGAAAASPGGNGWKWGGCSADVRSGASLAKRFADSRETEGDGRSLMNLHNNKAGRKVSDFIDINAFD